MNFSKLKNYKNWSLTTKAAFWFIVVSLIQKGFSFITVPIFTRVITQEQYGIYSTYLSLANIMTVFLTLNLETGAYSNVLGKEKEEKLKNEITLSYISLTFLLTLIFVIFLIIFPKIFSSLFNTSFLLLIFMAVEILSATPINLWVFQQRFKYKYKSLILYTIINCISNVLLGLLFVINAETNYQAAARIASVIVIKIIFALIIYIYYVLKTKKVFSTKKWKETLKFQLPLIPHYLSMNLLLSSDLIMIKKFIGTIEAANYSIAYSIGQVMIIIKQCLIDAIRPWIYNKLNNKKYKEINNITNVLIIVVTILSILLSVAAPEIVLVFASSKYSEAIYAIPPIALSSMFVFIFNLFVVIETYYKKTTGIMRSSVIAAILNIVLNLIFIPKFGYIIAGYTTMISYMILSLLHYLNIKKIEKEIGTLNLFNMKQISLISLLGIIFCLLISLLYKNIYVRYVTILLIFGTIYLCRKKLINIFMEVKNGKNK